MVEEKPPKSARTPRSPSQTLQKNRIDKGVRIAPDTQTKKGKTTNQKKTPIPGLGKELLPTGFPSRSGLISLILTIHFVGLTNGLWPIPPPLGILITGLEFLLGIVIFGFFTAKLAAWHHDKLRSPKHNWDDPRILE